MQKRKGQKQMKAMVGDLETLLFAIKKLRYRTSILPGI
jgi:hypothetical protein